MDTTSEATLASPAVAGGTDRLLSEARALGLLHDNSILPSYVVQGEELQVQSLEVEPQAELSSSGGTP